MNHYQKILTVTEAKNKFLDLVESVEVGHSMCTLTRNGKPAVVMLNLEDYEAMVETLEILSDPEILAALKVSKKQKKQRRLVAGESVW